MPIPLSSTAGRATSAAAAIVLSVAATSATGARATEAPPAPSTTVTLAPGGITPSAQESNGYDLTQNGEALSTVATQDVAPGLKVTNFQRLEKGGWNRGNILTADLSTPTLSMDLQNSGSIAAVKETSEQIKGTKAVAAINGDFFDMNGTGAPIGIGANRSGITNTPSITKPAFTIENGRAAIGALTASGTLRSGALNVRLAGLNTPWIPANGIGVYSPLWGTYTLDRPLGGADSPTHPVTRATVVGGVVTQVRRGAGAPDVPPGGQVIVGRELGSSQVGSLRVGDRVDLSFGFDRTVGLAVSGAEQLVTNGVVDTSVSDDSLHARTAIGVSRDGQKVIALTVDGNTTSSHGQRRVETGTLMKQLGAQNALLLDGGGSSTMVARIAGTSAPVVVNTPADGYERKVSNSLVFYSSAQPEGVATSAQVRPMTTRAGAYTVLQGQSRTIFGSGLDANDAPVETDGQFHAPGGLVTIAHGKRDTTVASGRRLGTANVRFDLHRGRSASMPLTVLGPLTRLEADKTSLPFPDASRGSTLQLTGYDADGRPSPIEPRDVTVEADPGVTVTADGANGFRVSPTIEKGSGLVRFRVGGHTLETAFTVGLDQTSLADFRDASQWKVANARATCTASPATGVTPDTMGLRLRYDFTTSTATRGCYAIPPAGISVPGHPLALNLWVKGDGSGVWPRIQITSGDGTVSNLDGEMVTFSGWKQVRFPIKDGTALPVRVDRIRMLETRPDALYRGDVTMAGLTAETAPVAPSTHHETVHDPVIPTNGTVDARPQRIAVLSDGQFVARDPNSPLLANVRRNLREIVAARPDHLVIDGDFVDEASPADFALAKKVIDEEVGDRVPWTYVPGNHEVMGGPITNFRAVFGPTHTTTRLGGTQLITLNSSSGTLHGNDDGTAQLTQLEDQLQAAAADPGITGVVIATHMPIDDPLPDKASQLGDRLEAQQLEDRLGRFRATSGKSVAVVNGHVGVFHGSSAQGVSMIINGNSGKTPAGTVSDGGFRGWTMLGIDPAKGVVGTTPVPPADRVAWLQAETHPNVDTLSLDAPTTLGQGESVTLEPTFTQGGATVPVAWPVSARWGGTNVRVASATDDEGAALPVRLDPDTHRLTAVRPGTATLTLTVGGVTQTRTVTVTG